MIKERDIKIDFLEEEMKYQSKEEKARDDHIKVLEQ